ncbi:hypothetical protein [Brachybacterium sp. FME24]|uniref:hypothetical protein n=1 Tax=Brachybacterium sp. FME24 TaxID=2742605 RepID=UPI00186689DE|nr:hypothetical protein [Brachybacterium sp. FME24]
MRHLFRSGEPPIWTTRRNRGSGRLTSTPAAAAQEGRPGRLLIAHDDVIIADLDTATLLAEFTIDLTRGYQTKKQGPGENRGPAS